jgi:hypothetical protein
LRLIPTAFAAKVTIPIRERTWMKPRCRSGVQPSWRALAKGIGSKPYGSPRAVREGMSDPVHATMQNREGGD